MASRDFEPYQVHGRRLAEKLAAAPTDAGLQAVFAEYELFLDVLNSVGGRSTDDVAVMVSALNRYKDAAEPVLDRRPNSAQEVLQPAILEEFIGHLFRPVGSGSHLVLRPEHGYLSLVFHPSTLQSLVDRPEFTVSRKDHDFVIGGELRLSVAGADGHERRETIVVPAVAIECKRYLERNMLDECSGTAERVKRATPYCLYVVVSEYLKMDDARPELSRIDEIYVLRKQRNSERLAAGFVPNPIDPSLVSDLYALVMRHLTRVWWDPD